MAFYTEDQIYRDPDDGKPLDTPLTDLLAASDPAGMDAEVMPFDDWVALHGSNGASAEVEPRYIYFEEKAP